MRAVLRVADLGCLDAEYIPGRGDRPITFECDVQHNSKRDARVER